jgi:glycosyltransferase involved in cell wall biosynthesis
VNPCLLIPNYDHGEPLAGVLEALARWNLKCLVVDDGSHAPTRRALEALEAAHPWVEVHARKENGGRGAALKTGYRLALSRGFSHAVQLDADGQHDAGDVGLFLREIECDPEALVLGAPFFDASAPRARLYGRQLSRWMVWLSTLSLDVSDPLCGFRGIPLAAAVDLLERVPMGDHMEFDPQLVILLHREGVRVRNVRTRVVYRPGGLSHFQMLDDNARMTALYARSLAEMLLHAPRRLWRRRPERGEAAGGPRDA